MTKLTKGETKKAASRVKKRILKYRPTETVQVHRFVSGCLQSSQIKEEFMTLNDDLRERAEEAVFSLRVRKRMVHSTIRALMKMYW